MLGYSRFLHERSGKSSSILDPTKNIDNVK